MASTETAHGIGCGCGLTRRGVFAGLGAAAAASVAAPAVTATRPYRIDVHHHIMPPQFLKEGPASVDNYRRNPKMNGWTKEKSVEVLDEAGIAKAMLSFPQPSQWSMETGEQRRLARLCNDFFAKVMHDIPGRFGLFAGVPLLQDIDGCLAEIDYAYGTLKADGVRLMTSYKDHWLGEPLFDPVMDELNRREAVVFVHPDAAACCRNNLQPGIGQGYVEYNFDSTRAALSLWYHDAFARWPKIKIILSHGGGALASLAGRMAVTGRPDPKGGKEPLHDAIEQFHKSIYVDTANANSIPAMRGALALMDPRHVLFGTDEPFIPIPMQLQQLHDPKLGLGPKLLRAIERDNALALIPTIRGKA